METANISLGVIVFLVILALAFDFMNGFHDAANAIATVVSTRVMKPHTAVAMAAICNVAAIFVFELKVAATVGKGTIEPNQQTSWQLQEGLIALTRIASTQIRSLGSIGFSLMTAPPRRLCLAAEPMPLNRCP